MTRVMVVAATALLAGALSLAGAPLQLEFFYEPGCKVCTRIQHEVLPEVNATYGDLVSLLPRDTTVSTNYLQLAAYQEALAIDPHATAVIIVGGRTAFSGWDHVRNRLMPHLDELVAQSIAEPPPDIMPLTLDDMETRVQGFTIAGVALAGLVDGINPCAISTLVFFISILSVMRVQGRTLLAVGAMFCAASFVTYTAIGLGLFHVLYLFSGLRGLQLGLTWSMAVILVILAVLSLRDAWRYAHSGHAADVSLKLPRHMSEMIHQVIRRGLRTHHLLFGSATAGAIVTVLESVCTGQVYLPTLVVVLRSGSSTTRVVAYLMLYNALFVLPLVVALILAYHGTRTPRFLEWSRRNVVPSKIAMAVFFVAMAVLIVML